MLSADPDRTRRRYPGVTAFDTRKGRLRAMISAARWGDIIIAGGGELVQDDSSLLYTPFNLLPLFLAFFLRKRSFAWAIGIGQGRELTFFSRLLTKLAMKTVSGVTVRDRGSFNTLYQMGLRDDRMLLAADCALLLASTGGGKENIIGAAPRDVSNRTRHLLPLELRKKLGLYKKTDPSKAASAWARLLDWYCRKYSAGVVLFPFHTGTLSNDDLEFCRLVAEGMKERESVEIADPGNADGFLKMISRCRVMISTPLHGTILAFASGSIPVSVSYSSKCTRFMEQTGLSMLVSAGSPGIPDRSTAIAVEEAWTRWDPIQDKMSVRREYLRKRAEKTTEFFRRIFRL